MQKGNWSTHHPRWDTVSLGVAKLTCKQLQCTNCWLAAGQLPAQPQQSESRILLMLTRGLRACLLQDKLTTDHLWI